MKSTQSIDAKTIAMRIILVAVAIVELSSCVTAPSQSPISAQLDAEIHKIFGN